jgi:hypothetical protein
MYKDNLKRQVVLTAKIKTILLKHYSLQMRLDP